MGKNALLIGNSNYSSDTLANPENDAKDLYDAFEQLGISSTLQTNLNQENFRIVLKEFCDEINKSHSEVVIFFYAGHGLQIGNINYLCPIDFNFLNFKNTVLCIQDREKQAKIESICLDEIIQIISATQAETKIFILDSCRNNPASTSRGVESTGTAPIAAPMGTLIAFSTSPGQKAADKAPENPNNGAFTYALLQNIKIPGLSIEEILKRTRITLYNMTGNVQISWEHSSLMGDLVLSTNTTIGSFPINYLKTAKCDMFYSPESATPIPEIIAGLKSHDYYRQNPATNEFEKVMVVGTEISYNDLFIIGRNIYQAACGLAHGPLEYIKHIAENFLMIEDKAKIFHLLNGMLFEIFFDSKGLLRQPSRYKLGTVRHENLFELVLLQAEKAENNQSKEFIRRMLLNYSSRIIYPIENYEGSYLEIELNFSNSRESDSKNRMEHDLLSIKYEDYFILYRSGGISLASISEDNTIGIDYVDLKTMLQKIIVCPQERIRFSCGELDIQNNDLIIVPEIFQLRKTPAITSIESEDIKTGSYN